MAYSNVKNLRRWQISKESKYYLSKEAFLQALYFAYRYQEFKDILEEMGDGSKALSYDGQPRGSLAGSSLEDLAIKRAKISAKIDLIESSCREADPELYFWLIKGVTSDTVGYNYLRCQLHMPCGRNQYYERRRKFYYILSHKLDN